MSVQHLTQIFFSPTGTTRHVLSAIAAGIAPSEIKGYDLTPPLNREDFQLSIAEETDLVLLGVPVYKEHVPEFLWPALNAIEGNNKPVILIAVYGNIGYGMALKDMEDWARRCGFKAIAAAAFIGEHSFSHPGLSLAEGRPDVRDLDAAREFGERIAGKPENTDTLSSLPGSLPMMARILPKDSAKFFSFYPKADMGKCTRCMRCLKVCPSGAIDPGTLNIDRSKCLHCFACVRVCTPKARKIKLKIKPLVKKVLRVQARDRKDPEIYI